jgi:adenine-specific DNA-methyltransferase
MTSVWPDTQVGAFTDSKIYVVQTNTKVIERCMLMTTTPGDLVLDPTCGSGTTAYVAEQWGRRWITIDTSRVALALARGRIMGARYDYYHLMDSADGADAEAKRTGKPPPADRTYGKDIRQGFVIEKARHVTLKSIANNAQIDTIWDRFRAEMDPLRDELNKMLGKAWKEWDIPREAGEKWPKEAERLHGLWVGVAPETPNGDR